MKNGTLYWTAYIDLIGIENLENLIKGDGENFKRIPIEELESRVNKRYAKISDNHGGLVILINKIYWRHFNNLHTFETTRGIWTKQMATIVKNQSIRMLLLSTMVL